MKRLIYIFFLIGFLITAFGVYNIFYSYTILRFPFAIDEENIMGKPYTNINWINWTKKEKVQRSVQYALENIEKIDTNNRKCNYIHSHLDIRKPATIMDIYLENDTTLYVFVKFSLKPGISGINKVLFVMDKDAKATRLLY